MPFATMKGAFLVKGGKFCTSCCGETGEGNIRWRMIAYAEEAPGATCSHTVHGDTGTGAAFFRTKTASFPDALAGAEGALSGAGFTTHGCPEVPQFAEGAFACGNNTKECCEGTSVTFSKRSGVKFHGGSLKKPATLSFEYSANDCDGKFDDNWSVKLHVSATQIIE